MGVNRHFEATVRIQNERGHQVVSSGPYKLIRHPGYLSIILGVLSTPLMIGSFLAYLGSLVVIVVIVIRTSFEDRMLQSKLSGYVEYARRVKYRIVPGIW